MKPQDFWKDAIYHVDGAEYNVDEKKLEEAFYAFHKAMQAEQKLNIAGVMQAEVSASAQGAAVGQRSVGTVAEAQAVTHGICKERNCNEPATKDYNGHEHWVCDYHYDKLNDEFDEEYK